MKDLPRPTWEQGQAVPQRQTADPPRRMAEAPQASEASLSTYIRPPCLEGCFPHNSILMQFPGNSNSPSADFIAKASSCLPESLLTANGIKASFMCPAISGPMLKEKTQLVPWLMQYSSASSTVPAEQIGVHPHAVQSPSSVMACLTVFLQDAELARASL